MDHIGKLRSCYIHAKYLSGIPLLPFPGSPGSSMPKSPAWFPTYHFRVSGLLVFHFTFSKFPIYWISDLPPTFPLPWFSALLDSCSAGSPHFRSTFPIPGFSEFPINPLFARLTPTCFSGPSMHPCIISGSTMMSLHHFRCSLHTPHFSNESCPKFQFHYLSHNHYIVLHLLYTSSQVSKST